MSEAGKITRSFSGLSGLTHSPRLMLCVIFLAFTARWVWVIGIGDCGWTYELGTRVLLGEAPHRDFVCTLPQLTTYTIVPFILLGKGSLWAWSLHLYVWWLVSLMVGLRLLAILGASQRLQVSAIFLAACVSFPALSNGQAYNYASTALFGLVLLGLVGFQRSKHGWPVLLAGAWAGLALFAKQNVGAAAIGIAALTITVICVQQKRRRELPVRLGQFALGWMATFASGFCYFAMHAGAKEVFAQMFLDAGQAKGGMPGLILRALPVLYFERDTPHRHLWTVIISAATTGVFLFWFVFRATHRDRPVADNAHVGDDSGANRLVLSALAIVIAILAVSLLPLPNFKAGLEALRSHHHPDSFGIIIFALYSAVISAGAVCLGSACLHRNIRLFIPCLWLAALVGGHAISAFSYLPFAAPVAAPLALYLFKESGLIRRVDQVAALIAILVVVAYTAFPMRYFAPTFEALHKLPAHTPFANLYGAGWYAGRVEQLHRHVMPQIQGRPTLWLCHGGPHLACGGRPVRSVALLNEDTYNVRSEGPLIEAWTADPPAYVFYEPFSLCANSRYFTPTFLQAWLTERYEPIWHAEGSEATLWKLK